jgi:hypothetical protein
VSEPFLQLPPSDRSKIYRSLAPKLGRTPEVLEKDVWVCWVLQTLFAMPDRLPMAFKGGTSLSKVFGAIHRFSEDVDVTLDFHGLDGSFDPFVQGISKNQLKIFGDRLKSCVRDHVRDVVAPRFQEALSEEFGVGLDRVEIGGVDGDQLRVRYPSVSESSGYIQESVLVEFGGRNTTEPNQEHIVRPDIADELPDLEFPTSRVNVLSPARTFWEKATLIHVECQRDEVRVGSNRLSRHWYDLAALADLPIGVDALEQRDLLVAVVKLKKVFYDAGYARYDDCLDGKFRLIPNNASVEILREDFRRMVGAGMFIGTAPSFESIIARLRDLERTINR